MQCCTTGYPQVHPDVPSPSTLHWPAPALVNRDPVKTGHSRFNILYAADFPPNARLGWSHFTAAAPPTRYFRPCRLSSVSHSLELEGVRGSLDASQMALYQITTVGKKEAACANIKCEGFSHSREAEISWPMTELFGKVQKYESRRAFHGKTLTNLTGFMFIVTSSPLLFTINFSTQGM